LKDVKRGFLDPSGVAGLRLRSAPETLEGVGEAPPQYGRARLGTNEGPASGEREMGRGAHPQFVPISSLVEVGVRGDVSVIQTTKAPKHQSTQKGPSGEDLTELTWDLLEPFWYKIYNSRGLCNQISEYTRF
jgi:hypothetical protein